MPKCLICNTPFFPQTFDSPAEPCDCGRQVDALERKSLSDAEFERLRHDVEREQAAIGDSCGDDATGFPS